MPQLFKLGDVAGTVAKAMVRQGRRYQRRSRGWAPWWAPEAMYREAAAEALYRSHRLHVVSEMKVNDVVEYGRGEMRGKRPRNSGQGRIDLVVLDGRPMPCVLIEFKRGLNGKTLKGDISRLRQLVKRRKCARFGLIAVHMVLRKRFKDREDQLRAFVRDHHVELLVATWYHGGWDVPGFDRDNQRTLMSAVMRV